MARIELTLGLFTLIDDADLPLVSGMKWYTGGPGYAMHSRRSGKHILLHRLLCGSPVGMDIDHRNGDRLDNRRANLRICTRSENLLNRASSRPGASKFLGVYPRSIWDRWFVLAPSASGPQCYAGDYTDELTAARAYDSVVAFHRGKNAKTNFADPIPMSPRELLIANGQCEPSASKYRGVWASGGKNSRTPFGASIYAGRNYRLGNFATERQAAKAYDAACILLGLRDRMNFPKSVPGSTAIDLARQALFPTAGKVAA